MKVLKLKETLDNLIYLDNLTYSSKLDKDERYAILSLLDFFNNMNPFDDVNDLDIEELSRIAKITYDVVMEEYKNNE